MLLFQFVSQITDAFVAGLSVSICYKVLHYSANLKAMLMIYAIGLHFELNTNEYLLDCEKKITSKLAFL